MSLFACVLMTMFAFINCNICALPLLISNTSSRFVSFIYKYFCYTFFKVDMLLISEYVLVWY